MHEPFIDPSLIVDNYIYFFGHVHLLSAVRGRGDRRPGAGRIMGNTAGNALPAMGTPAHGSESCGFDPESLFRRGKDLDASGTAEKKSAEQTHQPSGISACTGAGHHSEQYQLADGNFGGLPPPAIGIFTHTVPASAREIPRRKTEERTLLHRYRIWNKNGGLKP